MQRPPNATSGNNLDPAVISDLQQKTGAVISYLQMIQATQPASLGSMLGTGPTKGRVFDDAVKVPQEDLKLIEDAKATPPTTEAQNAALAKAQESQRVSMIEQSLVQSLNTPLLRDTYFNAVKNIDPVMDRKNYEQVRGTVKAFFAPIAETAEWKKFWVPFTQQLGIENDPAKQNILLDKLAGAFVFKIQSHVQAQFSEIKQPGLEKNMAFLTKIVNNAGFTNADEYLLAGRKDAVDRSINQAILIDHTIVGALKANNKDKISEAVQFLRIGNLFKADLTNAAEKNFRTLGDYGHVALNERIIEYVNTIKNINETLKKDPENKIVVNPASIDHAVRETSKVVLDHLESTYKKKALPAEVVESLAKLCEHMAQADSKYSKDYKSLAKKFEKNKIAAPAAPKAVAAPVPPKPVETPVAPKAAEKGVTIIEPKDNTRAVIRDIVNEWAGDRKAEMEKPQTTGNVIKVLTGSARHGIESLSNRSKAHQRPALSQTTFAEGSKPQTVASQTAALGQQKPPEPPSPDKEKNRLGQTPTLRKGP